MIYMNQIVLQMIFPKDYKKELSKQKKNMIQKDLIIFKMMMKQQKKTILEEVNIFDLFLN